MVTAALLLVTGAVPTAEEAIERILRARPGARMNRSQRRAVEELERSLS
jgi:protein-tyrosine phosphatase